MSSAVESAACKASAKLRALLRAKRIFNLHELVLQYKSHVLSLLEYPTPAIYHASSTVLSRTDRVQSRFLREVGLSEEKAFLDWNLCPLQCRRDIAMLGLLHKIVLGQAHPAFRLLFPAATPVAHGHGTRFASSLHDKQLLDRCDGTHSELMRRSRAL